MSKIKKDEESRVNYQIRAHRVLVIHDGQKLGEMHPKDAIAKAQELELDLVEVAPNAKPPVCTIMDYGKWKYDQSKKDRSSQSHSSKSEVKTVRMRQNTEDHDVETKLKLIKKFLISGKKVQLQIRSKGRELAHKDRGLEIAKHIIKELEEIGKPEATPRINGNEVSCRINPV